MYLAFLQLFFYLTISIIIVALIWRCRQLKMTLNQANHLYSLLVESVANKDRSLQQTMLAIQKAQQIAEQASSAKSNFLKMISHELGSPMTALQLQLLRLQRKSETYPATAKHIIQQAMQSAKRLGPLLDSLLERSRVVNIVVHPEIFDLHELTQHVVDDLAATDSAYVASTRINIVCHSHYPVLEVTSDKILVRIILINLISNALKFSPREKNVAVILQKVGDAFSLSVQDSGLGIPRDAQSRVFEPFVHLEPILYKHTPGLGLGLALVRDMVQIIGGQIEVESELGIGSTFTVRLTMLTCRDSF